MNQIFNVYAFQRFYALTILLLTSLLIPKYLVQAQEACVVTSTGKVICGKLQQNPKQRPIKQTVFQIEDNDFRFELQGCQRSNERVRCNLMVTNIAAIDRNIKLSRFGTRIITNSGDEIKPQEVQLGQNKGPNSSAALATGVPMKGAIIFETVPRYFSTLSLLEVNYRYGSWHTVKFRNVNIQSNSP